MPTYRRKMIMPNGEGLALDGEPLEAGQLLEVRLPTEHGPAWFPVKVCRVSGEWVLQLKTGKAWLAVGSYARRQLETFSPKVKRILQRLRYCRNRCGGRVNKSKGCPNCQLPLEKRQWARDKNMPEIVKKQCA